MVKKYGFIFFMSIIICILQQAIFSRVEILNVGFDLVFVFLICFALLNNEIESIVLAILCGLIRDSFFPYLFGINTVLFVLSAYCITLINKKIYKDSILIPISLTFAFSIVKGLIYFGYFYVSSIKFDFMGNVLNVILFESLYNSIVSIFIYIFIKKTINPKIMQQDWKF